MYPNWNYWNWKIWKKAILGRTKRTTAKPFLSQANQDWRREEQIGSSGLRFERVQIRQNTRMYTLKMHFPLQGRFQSLLKREVARCALEGINVPRVALERKIEGMAPFVHQNNSLVTSGAKGSCTANRTFTDSRLYELEKTHFFLPLPHGQPP